MANTASTPWQDAYPAPKSVAPLVGRAEVLRWFREGREAGRDFVLVDVRRTDREGGTIRGSLNLPAQTLFPSLATLHSLLASSGVKQVVWYCGSCGGRGPRAAAWFADYLDVAKDEGLQSLVLEGGIKGWVAAGEEYTEWMDEYDAGAWKK